jgi:hypothetical protein
MQSSSESDSRFKIQMWPGLAAADAADQNSPTRRVDVTSRLKFKSRLKTRTRICYAIRVNRDIIVINLKFRASDMETCQ